VVKLVAFRTIHEYKDGDSRTRTTTQYDFDEMATDWNRGTLKYSDDGTIPPAPDGKKITRKTSKMLHLYNLKRLNKLKNASKAKLRARDIRRLNRDLRHTIVSVGDTSAMENLYRPPAEESDLDDSGSEYSDEDEETNDEVAELQEVFIPPVWEDTAEQSRSPDPEADVIMLPLPALQEPPLTVATNSLTRPSKPKKANPKKRKAPSQTAGGEQPRKSPTCQLCQKEGCPGGTKKDCIYLRYYCRGNFKECCGARNPDDGWDPRGPRLPCKNVCSTCGHPACNSKGLGVCPNKTYMEFYDDSKEDGSSAASSQSRATIFHTTSAINSELFVFILNSNKSAPKRRHLNRKKIVDMHPVNGLSMAVGRRTSVLSFFTKLKFICGC
jgi:hypothetical protein